jgi:hypothetical protein
MTKAKAITTIEIDTGKGVLSLSREEADELHAELSKILGKQPERIVVKEKEYVPYPQPYPQPYPVPVAPAPVNPWPYNPHRPIWVTSQNAGIAKLSLTNNTCAPNVLN